VTVSVQRLSVRYRARFKKNLEMQRDISIFTRNLDSLRSLRQIGKDVTKIRYSAYVTTNNKINELKRFSVL